LTRHEPGDEASSALAELNRDQVSDSGGWPTDERLLIWRVLDAIGMNVIFGVVVFALVVVAGARSGGI
jgi:hypothetical protein